MKPETVMWLLPVMFMLHDFEEIILMRPWGLRFSAILNDRLPAPIRRMSNATLNLSTPAFAFAVMLIYILFAAVTLLCVEFNLYNFWTAILIIYFVHLLLHIGQAIYLRNYVPAVITSVLTGIYSVAALVYAIHHFNLIWIGVLVDGVIALAAVALALAGIVWLAQRVNTWIGGYERGE